MRKTLIHQIEELEIPKVSDILWSAKQITPLVNRLTLSISTIIVNFYLPIVGSKYCEIICKKT